MEKNKTGKYLKYAIGEILLVVIGILIALQINNWNNNKTNIRESNQFNKRLLAEVSGNIDLANSKIKTIKSTINSSKGILELFNNQPIKISEASLRFSGSRGLGVWKLASAMYCLLPHLKSHGTRVK